MDVAKEVLRCPNLDALHQSDAELYLFLYVYFQRLAIQQKHERSIAISMDDVKNVLSSVLAKQLPPPLTNNNSRGAAAGLKQQGPSHTSKDVFLQQRALRDQLTSLRINCTAFGEVMEVTRLLDQKCGVSTPFGAVQLLHFTAVFITLCSTRCLFDLIAAVVDCKPLDDPEKLRILELWAMIDAVNAAPLLAVCGLMRSHPGITSPLLLELMPSVQHVHTEKYQPAPITGSDGPRIVQHCADDVGAETVAGLATVGTAAEEDPELVQSAEDRAFWANLAK